MLVGFESRDGFKVCSLYYSTCVYVKILTYITMNIFFLQMNISKSPVWQCNYPCLQNRQIKYITIISGTIKI